jgi:5-methyltetrahydropteroyltriglutamate--homocysteine methyltransferase
MPRTLPRGTLPGMAILTEPIGSIPRPATLIRAIAAFQAGNLSRTLLDDEYATALRDTIERFQRTGSPVISDGEQTKPSFATYPLSGLTNLAPDGVIIPFADGHVRQLPRYDQQALPLRRSRCQRLSKGK